MNDMKREYLERMEKMLGEEYPQYLACMGEPWHRALRVNLLRTDAETFCSMVPYTLKKTPFAENSYYADTVKETGSLLYAAGVYYMQEASASAAVTILDPKPGMLVLDLCAAPGSKSTQILEQLGGQGLLAANEIVHRRSLTLLENTVRHGAENCYVLNETPQRIAETFPEAFDAVLADAPCSGEGMFRRNPEAALEWTENAPAGCAMRQAEILDSAYGCLKKGGRLVYSTCTFSMEENEETVSAFLKRHPDMRLCDPGVTFGRHGLNTEKNTFLCRRIYPMDGGEGHFAALMIKEGSGGNSVTELRASRIPDEVFSFLKECGSPGFPYLHMHNDRIYGGNHPFIDTGRCRVIRGQVLLGEMRRGRFEPDHAFFMAASNAMRSYELTKEQAEHYLSGEQIRADCPKGWVRVTYKGFPLGGARSDGNALKNKYPKHLRIR